METPDIRILVGVRGGAGLSAGSSGKLIKDTLVEIAQKISDSKAVKVAVAIDEKSAVAELKKVLESLSAVANSFKFSPTSDGSEKLIQSYDKLIQKSEELQKLRETFNTAKANLDATDVKSDNYKTVVAEYKAAANALHTAVAAATSKEAESAKNLQSLISIIPKLSSALASGDVGIADSRSEQINEKYAGLSQLIANILQAKTALTKDSAEWIDVEKIVQETGVSSDALKNLFDVLELGRQKVAAATLKEAESAFPGNFVTRVQESVKMLQKAFSTTIASGDDGAITRAVAAVDAQINDLNIDKIKDIGTLLKDAIGGADRNAALTQLRTALEEAEVPAKNIETIFKSIEKAQSGVAEKSRVIRESLIGKYQTSVDSLGAGGKLSEQLSEAGIDPQKINEYREALVAVVTELNNVDRAMDEPSATAEGILAEIREILGYKEQLADLKKTFETSSSKYSAYQGNSYLSSGYAAVRKVIDSASTSQEVKNATEMYRQWEEGVQKLGLAHESLRGKIEGVLGQFGITLSIAALIGKARSELKELVAAVQEVDSAMVELKKVTDESQETYDKFLSNAKSKSHEIGSSVSDLVNASSLFAKMGFNLDDSFDLGTTATILANVGDDIGTIDDAATTLISVLKSYGLEASEAASVTDKLNEVSNRFPISAGGISNALQRSSAAMSAAGNTLDETISLITVANQVVNDPESVGTGWRTIALRIRGAKAELEEAGEDTDGLITSTAELQKEIQALTRTSSNKSGVNILADDGSFKSTYQIIKEIGEVWNQISDVNQSALLEDLGGKRGAQILTSVFSNIGDLDSVTSASVNSANSALEEHANWLDSIEAKQAQLSSAYQSFADSFLGSDIVKLSYDVGSNLLALLTQISDTLGGLPVAVTAVTSALGLLGKNNGILTYGLNKNGEAGITTVFRKMFDVGDTTENIQAVIDVYNKLDEAQRASITTSGEYQTAMSKLSTGMQSYINSGNLAGQTAQSLAAGYSQMKIKAFAAQVAVSALNVAISFGVSLAISAIIGLISDFVNQSNEAIESTQELTKSLNEELSGIDSYKEKALALTKELQDQTLSSEEVYQKRQQLLTIQEEMIEQYGYEATKINILCGSVNELADAFANLSKAQATRKLAEGYDGFGYAWDDVKNSQNTFSIAMLESDLFGASSEDEISNQISDWASRNNAKILEGANGAYLSFVDMTAEEATQKYSEFSDFLKTLEAKYNVDLSNFRKIMSVQIGDAMNSEYTASQSLVDSYMALLVQYDDRFSGYYGAAQEAISAYQDGLAKGYSQTTLDGLYKDVIEAYTPDLSNITGPEAEAAEYYFRKLREAFEQQAQTTKVSVDLDKIVTVKGGGKASVREVVGGLTGLTSSEVKNMSTYTGGDNSFTLEELGVSPYTQDQAKAFNVISAAAIEAGMSVEDYIDSLVELGYIAGDVATVEQTQAQSMSNVSTSCIEHIRILNEAIAEQERMGYISDETYRQLVAANKDWGDAVDASSGRVVASTDDLQGYIDKQINAGYQALITAGATQEETDEFLQLSSAMTSLTFDDVAASQYGGAVEYVSAVLQTMRNEVSLTAPEVKSLSAAFPALAAQIRDGTLSVVDMTGLLVSSTEQIIDVVSKAVSGYVFNEQEITKLIALYPELADAITQTSNGYLVDASSAQTAAQEKVKAANDAIQAQIAETNAVIQNIRTRISGYQAEILSLAQVMKSLSQYSTGLLNGITDYNNMTIAEQREWRTYFEALSATKKAKANLASSKSALADAQTQLEKLTSSLASVNTSYNTATDAVKNYTSAQNGSSGTTNSATKALQDQKEALEDQRDLLNDQLDAVNDLIDLVVKMIKQEKKLEKEGLQSQLESYKALIDAQKELLSLKEEERDYEKDLGEATEKVDKIQAKINALQYDDSAEANAKRLSLYEELNDAKAELEELNHDREVTLQEQALDEEYERYETQLNKQIDAIDDYLSKEGQIRQDAMALIDTKSQELYNRLISYNRLYGDGVDKTVAGAWSKAYAALNQYGGGVLNVLNYLNSAIAGLDSQIDALASSLSNASTSASGLGNNLAGAIGNAAGLASTLGAVNSQLGTAVALSAELNNNKVVTPQQGGNLKSTEFQAINYRNLGGPLHLYHTGGVVGDKQSGELFKSRTLKPDELLAVLQKGEVVMTQEHQNNLLSFIKSAFETPTAGQINVDKVSAASSNNTGIPGQVVMGDVIINGNADASTVESIRKVQEQLASRVFEMIQGMSRQMGYSRNVKAVSV